MIPAATALNLIPWVAYSIASALVTAFRPPFVRIGRDADTPAIGWSARLVLIVTTCPDFRACMLRTANCVTWKNPVTLVDTSAARSSVCLLYTSDAADERSSVDL